MASLSEEIQVPDIGDFDEVDVVEVLVQAGDRVAAEDPLITLESDKATMDVPAPKAGKVIDLKVKVGDKVGQGAVILILEIDTKDADAVSENDAATEGEPASAAEEEDSSGAGRGEQAGADPGRPEIRETEASRDGSPAPIDEFPDSSVYASPAIRRFARQLGVDLHRVKGTGRKGRILKEDVQGFVKKTMAGAAAPGTMGLPPMPVVDFSKFGEIEREPLTRIQRLSLASVRRSWLHVPHVTQHDEADITEMEAFRKAHKEEAKAKGFKLTPVAFAMKASVAALKEFPRVNSSLDADEEHVVLKKYYHIAVAVDTPQGLVVPVIRNVDRKGIFDLARELGDVSHRAREGKLKLDEMRGASFTITSLGGIGGTAFTPIVNAPEVAILGLSKAREAPVWNGSSWTPRLMLPLSLSYDHRVIDGALAVRFTSYLSQALSDLRRMLL
ncbi:MAG: dihydrolipoyllysine-residue acetyltransferase [Acidobacteriota bacterium]